MASSSTALIPVDASKRSPVTDASYPVVKATQGALLVNAVVVTVTSQAEVEAIEKVATFEKPYVVIFDISGWSKPLKGQSSGTTFAKKYRSWSDNAKNDPPFVAVFPNAQTIRSTLPSPNTLILPPMPIAKSNLVGGLGNFHLPSAVAERVNVTGPGAFKSEESKKNYVENVLTKDLTSMKLEVSYSLRSFVESKTIEGGIWSHDGLSVMHKITEIELHLLAAVMRYHRGDKLSIQCNNVREEFADSPCFATGNDKFISLAVSAALLVSSEYVVGMFSAPVDATVVANETKRLAHKMAMRKAVFACKTLAEVLDVVAQIRRGKSAAGEYTEFVTKRKLISNDALSKALALPIAWANDDRFARLYARAKDLLCSVEPFIMRPMNASKNTCLPPSCVTLQPRDLCAGMVNFFPTYEAKDNIHHLNAHTIGVDLYVQGKNIVYVPVPVAKPVAQIMEDEEDAFASIPECTLLAGDMHFPRAKWTADDSKALDECIDNFDKTVGAGYAASAQKKIEERRLAAALTGDPKDMLIFSAPAALLAPRADAPVPMIDDTKTSAADPRKEEQVPEPTPTVVKGKRRSNTEDFAASPQTSKQEAPKKRVRREDM